MKLLIYRLHTARILIHIVSMFIVYFVYNANNHFFRFPLAGGVTQIYAHMYTVRYALLAV